MEMEIRRLPKRENVPDDDDRDDIAGRDVQPRFAVSRITYRDHAKKK